MKNIKKILVLNLLLVLPFLFNFTAKAFDQVDGKFGAVRLVESGLSDVMAVEFETLEGFVEFNELSDPIQNFTNYYGELTQINYVLPAPISLKNESSAGMPITVYPAGTILKITNTDMLFYSAQIVILESFTQYQLEDHYFNYDLFLDDYFLGYTEGYSQGYSAGYQEAPKYDEDSAYYDGYEDGDFAGYQRGYLAGYENGYLAGQENETPDPTPPSGNGTITPADTENNTFVKKIIIAIIITLATITIGYYVYDKFKPTKKRK